MRTPDYFKDNYENLKLNNAIILEELKESKFLHESNKEIKEYENNYFNDKYNLDELNVSVDNLYKELKKESKTLNNNIQKIKKNLKLSKKQNSKLSSNSTGMDDTERAIVEMTNSYKDMQIDSFLHALDISLGILGLFYLIYKKTN